MTPDLNSGHWLAAKAIFAFELLIATFGIVTNIVLLLATYRSTALKSKCDFLIGACAFFDVIHLAGNFAGLSMMFGDGHIDAFTCSALQFPSEIALYAGCFCVLSIGLDRLFSVSLVVFYRNIKRKIYLAVHLAAICLFASYVPYLMIKYYESHHVVCSLPESFHGEGKILWMQTMLVVNILTLVPYALTWINLRSREESSYTKRVFRAIALVMIFDVGGWLLAVALTILIYTIDISDETRLVLLYCCGCIVHFGISIKPVIYYNTSTEYRHVFRSLFGLESCYITTHSHSSSLPNKKMIVERIELTNCASI